MADEVDPRDHELFEQSMTTSAEGPTTVGTLRAIPAAPRESSMPGASSRRAEGSFSSAELSLQPSLRPLPFQERYTTQRVLDRGGMGEVRLCRDHSIGRDVAMKVIKPPTGATLASLERRFVREARVQGQLEHPSIVPMYDAGIAPDGALYFTMKRVRGVSLAQVLRELHERNAATVQRYSRRRLLAIFSQVCMAVHFGHQKGVVHRDVKPANVMLGGFGEVYLLDWGLAALRGDPVSGADADSIDDGHGAHSLATGVVGTPGFMAPEQVEPGQAVDARADIYALGGILFELLSGRRMHEGRSAVMLVASTLDSDGASPAERAPDRDVPPELDRLCRQATRRCPSERLSSAEILSREVEAYLDGDRDVSLRRELALEHAVRAEVAFARSHHEGADEAQERTCALREVSAALALDPGHVGARKTLMQLITEPPRAIPPEAHAAIEQNRLQAYRMTGRAALLYYFGYLLYLPLLLWMGVRDWKLFAVGWASIFACVVVTIIVFRYPPKRIDAPLPHLLVSTFTMAASSVVFGPFVFVPMLVVANAVSYMASVGHRRGLVPLSACLCVVVPLALQWLGIMPSNYSFENGTWTILPSVFYIRPLPTQLFLLAATLGTLIPVCWLVHRLRKAYAEAEEKLQLQAWQLRQIIPSSFR